MNIYELDNKGLRKVIREFGKTTYGKVVFILSYMIPFIMLIAAAEFLIIPRFSEVDAQVYKMLVIVSLVLSFISFVLGSRFYYRELRKYIETQNK